MAWSDDFWSLVCGFRRQMVVVLYFLVVLLVLTGFTLALGNPESASYMLALIDVALIVIVGGVIGAVYWQCQRRADSY
ncbi:MAG: hypothetical protein ABEJ89_08290 [Haloarculaceae archaeon]